MKVENLKTWYTQLFETVRKTALNTAIKSFNAAIKLLIVAFTAVFLSFSFFVTFEKKKC